MNALADEVYVELDVFGVLVVDGVGAHVHSRYVVTVSDSSLGDGAVEFAKELTQPDTLGRRVRHRPVLGLRARTRDRGFALRGPRDQQVTKEDAEPRGRPPCIRAAGLVSVRVRRDVKLGRGAQMQSMRCRPADVEKNPL